MVYSNQMWYIMAFVCNDSYVLMDELIVHLYPNVGMRNTNIGCMIKLSSVFGGHFHHVTYSIYVSGFDTLYYRDVRKFCIDMGMDEEHTLLWVIRFGDSLPEWVCFDKDGVSYFHGDKSNA